MRAVIHDVSEELLAWRRRSGADRWDEMWDGELHVAPLPDLVHQDLQCGLLAWLRNHWAAVPGRRVFGEFNVSRPGLRAWTRDYRVPDLVLVTPARAHVVRRTHFAGGPDVVVELTRPGDETDAKLPFYAAVGCGEIWVIDRDTRRVAIHSGGGGDLALVRPSRDGWIRSAVGVELKTLRKRLAIRLAGDPATRVLLP